MSVFVDILTYELRKILETFKMYKIVHLWQALDPGKFQRYVDM